MCTIYVWTIHLIQYKYGQYAYGQYTCGQYTWTIYIYIDIVGAKEVTLQHTVYFIYYANTNANTTNYT